MCCLLHFVTDFRVSYFDRPKKMANVQSGANVTVENGDSRFTADPQTGFTRFLDIVNTITHLTLGAVAFTIIFVAVAVGAVDKLSQHIILVVLGYVLLMTQSVLVMSPSNGWSRTIKYQDRKIVHMVMHIIGAIIALSGAIIALMEKDVHFDSTHGIMGLTAMILTIISLIGGLVHFFALTTRITCLLHSVFGALTLTVAFLALIFGIDQVFRVLFGDSSTNTLIAIIVISLCGTLLPSFLKFQRGCFKY